MAIQGGSLPWILCVSLVLVSVFLLHASAETEWKARNTRVKRHSSSDAEPELQRVKRGEPELQRVKRGKRHTLEVAFDTAQSAGPSDRRLVRVKRDRPELLRVKRGEDVEVSLNRVKRGDALSDALERVKRGQELEDRDLQRVKRSRRSVANSLKDVEIKLKKESTVHHQHRSTDLSEKKMKIAPDVKKNVRLTKANKKKKALKGNHKDTLVHHHKRNKQGKVLKKNKTEVQDLKSNKKKDVPTHDVKKQKKKIHERADKKNKKHRASGHNKKLSPAKFHSKHKKSASVSSVNNRNLGKASRRRKNKMERAKLALEHRQFVQHKKQRKTHLKTKKARAALTPKRKSQAIKKVKLHILKRIRQDRKKREFQPVFLRNVKDTRAVHHKSPIRRHKFIKQ